MASISSLPPSSSHGHIPPIISKERGTITPITSEESLRKRNQARADRIVEKIWNCPPVRELYQKAYQVKDSYGRSGPWRIAFVNSSGKVGDDKILQEWEGHNACIDFDVRRVYISENLSEDLALSSYVFELTNAIQKKIGDEFKKKAAAGTIGCEEFVEQMEKIEFDGALMHHRIVREAIDKYQWDESTDTYWNADILDFKKDYEENKYSAHANYYRRLWRHIRSENSCKINLVAVGFFGIMIALHFLQKAWQK